MNNIETDEEFIANEDSSPQAIESTECPDSSQTNQGYTPPLVNGNELTDEGKKHVFGVLCNALETEGKVTPQSLRRLLADDLGGAFKEAMSMLRCYDPAAEPEDPSAPKPPCVYHRRGYTYYSQEAYIELEEQVQADADEAGKADESQTSIDNEEESRQESVRRQDEKRMAVYVLQTLADIYASEYCETCAFDVQNSRSGAKYENVDIIALDWRSPNVVDIVTVEVKLEFSSLPIQQALSYRRFSNRVWIAVQVEKSFSQCAVYLRTTQPLLFQYAVDQGLGILACKRAPGRGVFEVAPIQWPRFYPTDYLEREAFIQRYRECFEESCVIPKNEAQSYPMLR